MVGIRTVELQLGFEGNTVGQTTIKTFLNGVTRFINVIIDKLKNKIIAGISNREIFRKNFVKSVILAQFAGSVKLQEISERL